MAINKVRLPVIGTDVGGHAQFAGFVPVLNPSGKLDASMLPGANSTYIQTKSVTVERPTNNEKIVLFTTKGPIVITSMESIVFGASNASVTWTLKFETAPSIPGTAVVVGGSTSTVATPINAITAFDNPNIPADYVVWLETSAVVAAPSQFHLTIQYQ